GRSRNSPAAECRSVFHLWLPRNAWRRPRSPRGGRRKRHCPGSRRSAGQLSPLRAPSFKEFLMRWLTRSPHSVPGSSAPASVASRVRRHWQISLWVLRGIGAMHLLALALRADDINPPAAAVAEATAVADDAGSTVALDAQDRHDDVSREARRDDERRGFRGPRDGERRIGPPWGGPGRGGPPFPGFRGGPRWDDARRDGPPRDAGPRWGRRPGDEAPPFAGRRGSRRGPREGWQRGPRGGSPREFAGPDRRGPGRGYGSASHRPEGFD